MFVFFLVPSQVYWIVGIIVGIGIVYLDNPRVKSILKKHNLDGEPIWLYVIVELFLDTVTWVYSLLSFTYLVFSGKWEEQLNGKL